MIKAIGWRDGKVSLIDQTRLPLERAQLELDSYKEVVRAINELRIRGAPAIGVAGAHTLRTLAKLSIEEQERRITVLVVRRLG